MTMSKNKSTRRNFLQFLGLSAGASVVSVTALGSMINATEIKKLNPKQQEFMIRYGKWMNDFIEAVRIKKTDPGNNKNNKKITALAEVAETFKPELSEFMQDDTFRLVYKASSERVTKEI